MGERRTVRFAGYAGRRGNACRHLGMDLVSENKFIAESYSRRIGQSQKTFSSLWVPGIELLPVPPNVLSKLYWSVVIPKMTYGMEIVPITETGMSKLEKVHRNYARVIQNLPVSTPMPSKLATEGWLSIDAFIYMRKLTFLWQILLISANAAVSHKRFFVELQNEGQCRDRHV